MPIKNYSKRIGFMQGRLVAPEKKNTIQFFPSKNWKKELLIASNNNFKIMEWTINYENLGSNPLFNGNMEEVKKMLKITKIKIPSITYDYFMEKPFFKKKNNKNKKEILLNLKKIIENSNKIDVKYHVFPLVDNSSIKSKIEEKNLIKEIKKLLKFIKKGSKILFEIDYKPEKVINFIELFNSIKVGINYDTGNSAGLNYDFNHEIKYLKYINNIHIKDRILHGETVRLGKGNWKYKDFFKLIKNKYRGNFILQTARSNGRDDLKEILINRSFFENAIK